MYISPVIESQLFTTKMVFLDLYSWHLCIIDAPISNTYMRPINNQKY